MMSSWRDEYVPTHRCQVCGALWRYWPRRDTGIEDSWGVCTACGPCCDNAPMLEQIVPVSIGDIEKYIAARMAAEVMKRCVIGTTEKPENADEMSAEHDQ